jgi:hypothetical protein
VWDLVGNLTVCWLQVNYSPPQIFSHSQNAEYTTITEPGGGPQATTGGFKAQQMWGYAAGSAMPVP